MPRLLLLATLLAVPVAAQRPAAVPLAQVIGAFLVDSGVRTTGLPWTTGNALPVEWGGARPAATTDQWIRQLGFTHSRSGRVRVTLGDSVTLPILVTALGSATALGRVIFSFESLLLEKPDGSGFLVHREMVETALRNDGVQLQPLKCSRATEGASYGNLVDAARMPGKTASGLWWFWQTAGQEPQLMLTILYRRTEMSEVECYSG